MLYPPKHTNEKICKHLAAIISEKEVVLLKGKIQKRTWQPSCFYNVPQNIKILPGKSYRLTVHCKALKLIISEIEALIRVKNAKAGDGNGSSLDTTNKGTVTRITDYPQY